MQHLIDTEIKLATCNRCERYVFTCQVNGVRTTADPAPVDRDAFARALLDGRSAYWMLSRGGRPWKLRSVSAALMGSLDEWPPTLADHNCGTRAMNATPLASEVAEIPQRARVRPGRPSGGLHHQNAPAEPQTGTQRPSRPHPAESVNPRPSRNPLMPTLGSPGIWIRAAGTPEAAYTCICGSARQASGQPGVLALVDEWRQHEPCRPEHFTARKKGRT